MAGRVLCQTRALNIWCNKALNNAFGGPKSKRPKLFVMSWQTVERFTETTEQLKALLPFDDESFEWLNVEDQTAHISHSVVLQDGHLIASLYIAPKALLPDRDWVASLFKRERLSAMHRKALLAGQAMSMTNSDGPLVCSCFKVGKNRIIDVIKEKKYHP